MQFHTALKEPRNITGRQGIQASLQINVLDDGACHDRSAHVEISIIEQAILSEGTGLVISDIVIDQQLPFVQLIA